MIKLTDNFYYPEFFVSKDFPALAEEVREYAPKTAAVTFYLLSHSILQPTRDAIQDPDKEIKIIITSGGRNRRLVKAIYLKMKLPPPGVSLHEYYIAVDFTCGDKKKTREAFEFIRDNLSDQYGQLIYYEAMNVVHVSLPTPYYNGKNKITVEK